MSQILYIKLVDLNLPVYLQDMVSTVQKKFNNIGKPLFQTSEFSLGINLLTKTPSDKLDCILFSFPLHNPVKAMFRYIKLDGLQI